MEKSRDHALEPMKSWQMLASRLSSDIMHNITDVISQEEEESPKVCDVTIEVPRALFKIHLFIST